LIRTIIHINTNANCAGDSSNFVATLNKRFHNVVMTRVVAASVPNTIDHITGDNNKINVAWKTEVGIPHYTVLTIPTGSYLATTLADVLNALLLAEGLDTYLEFEYENGEGEVQRFVFKAQPGYLAFLNMNSPYNALPIFMGFTQDDLTIPSFRHNAVSPYQGFGFTTVIYLNSPVLFNQEHFTSTSPELNEGVIAAIPVQYGTSGVEAITYNPTTDQLYTFYHDPPLTFQELPFVFFGFREIPDGGGEFHYINFNNATVQISIEIEWFKGYVHY